MNGALYFVYDWARRVSRLGLISVIFLLLLYKLIFGEINLTAQLVIALMALMAGIPHGAIDHLISMPSKPRSKFALYIFIYILIAVLAGWAIAIWNLNAFRAVLIMSALHFGFGDASYLNESQDALGKRRHPLLVEVTYALAAGSLPIALPLTDDRTLSALRRINPKLEFWAGSQGQNLRLSVLIFSGVALFILLAFKKFSIFIDLVLLLALSLFAPPLITFAAYFGLWHAIRHTARLVPKLESANRLVVLGDWRKAIWRAIYPGLYAVVGTLVLALAIMTLLPGKFSSSLLWSTLVIVWALTVPHMMVTSQFDVKALKNK